MVELTFKLLWRARSKPSITENSVQVSSRLLAFHYLIAYSSKLVMKHRALVEPTVGQPGLRNRPTSAIFSAPPARANCIGLRTKYAPVSRFLRFIN